MLRGYGVKKPYAGEDMLQLGGDFIIDRHRGIVFAYPSADPTDRPAISTILAAVPSVPPIGDETAPDGPKVDRDPPRGYP